MIPFKNNYICEKIGILLKQLIAQLLSEIMNILVIIAHPDDEVLGMGGTILKHPKRFFHKLS